MSLEVQHRLKAADKCYFGLRKHFRSHYINIRTKCILYETLIRPVLLYGAETWATTKCDKNKIRTFERKILRRIYGPVNEGGRWRIRYNDELYQLFNEPEIVKEVKSRRVRWLGHLFRTEEQYPCRKLTFTRPYSTRKIGRPPKRWLDCAEEDLRECAVSRWKTRALDRVQWKSITKAVKAGKQLSNQ